MYFWQRVTKSGRTKFSKWIRSVFGVRANEAQFLYGKCGCVMHHMPYANSKKYFPLQIFWQLASMQTIVWTACHTIDYNEMVAQSSCNCLKATWIHKKNNIRHLGMFDIHGSRPEKQTNEEFNAQRNENRRKVLPFKIWWNEARSGATVFGHYQNRVECEVGHFHSSHWRKFIRSLELHTPIAFHC